MKQLNTPGADVLELLRRFENAAHGDLWRRDVRLHVTFVRRLMSEGHPARAFELARAGLTIHPANHELQYLRALALARGGNTSKATEYAQALLQETALDRVLESEALSLLGRLAKDRFERTPSSQKARRRKLADESAVCYIRASQVASSSFPLINAATMSLLAGNKERAHELATQAIERAQSERRVRNHKNDAWLLATLGEAFLVLGDVSSSSRWYRQAAQAASGRRGDLASMRRNIALLQTCIKGSQSLSEIFNCGRVVVFAATSNSSQEISSLPKILESALRASIAQHLDALDATIGYCWPSCAASILFAEALLKRGGELHLVLPVEDESFVAPVAELWRARCEKLIEGATQIHRVTRENFLKDRVLFDFATDVMQGLALTQARELNARTCALVVVYEAPNASQSSTRLTERNNAADFVSRWNAVWRNAEDGGENARIEQSQIIDGLALRIATLESGNTPANARLKSQNREQNDDRKEMVHQRARRVKAMLFADVKNFSKLSEEQTPAFFVTFLDKVAREIAASKRRPAFANTWGDGLFLVFDNAGECADFALRLLERIEKTDWTKVGLPSDTTIRMGIHAGPVYASRDKIIGRINFFGAHVNRAARIEPVTTPGCAFATEQFASLLAIETGEMFRCEYVGVEELAKGYDRCVLYRLSRM